MGIFVFDKEGKVPQGILDAGSYLIAQAIVADDSRQVNFPLKQYGEEEITVTVFGTEADELGRRPSQATRTEINLGKEGKVVVHKNYDPGRGILGAVVRLDEVEVIPPQGQIEILEVTVDPNTSPYNPVYVFSDGAGNEVGVGSGQHMELNIAEAVTTRVGDQRICWGDPCSSVDWEVIEWIRTKLSA